ncbi:DUF736 family protein [Caulobacter sp. 602-2]|uniref:DUF736 family protein n=1 Tax=Caulobacter sp. 602-2 TaxID=2710887 RepID=A0A6G4QUI4_9CAUL|nr:DUF736 family protein [Caulobacter sp. 602-2]
MAVIGRFRPSRSGGWEGEIRSLLLTIPLCLKPNDDRRSSKAPAFRVMRGWAQVGDAWEARTRTVPPRPMLRVVFDDPSLPAKVEAALLPDASGERAILLWRRGLRTDGRTATCAAAPASGPEGRLSSDQDVATATDEAVGEHLLVLDEAQPCPNKNS